MNKKDANVEAKKIYDKWKTERNKIEKDAKKNGTWVTEGLDSNNHLFKEIDDKAKEELKKLSNQINE